MAFIQECFVRNPENKFRLIVELERLGYRSMYLEWRNNIEGANLVCEGQTWHCTDSDNKPWCIDCGTNEDMFLALAALRDDTDKGQWFICTEEYISVHTMDFVKVGTWQLNTSLDRLTYGLSRLWRKATAEEIVEHFKDTQP